MSEVYYCKNCGGVMEFDAETQGLKCPNCGTEEKIENNSQAVQEHKLTDYAKRTIRAEEKKSSTMQCPSCGAIVEVEATSTAKDCPYCGTPFVLAEKQLSNVVPDGVVPFRVDKKKVGELFRKWMKGRWLAPGELKHLYQQDKLQGIYIPYWTFDAEASADYHAEGGTDHQVEYKDSKGERHVRTETRWRPTSGHVSEFFDDVLVHASDRLSDRLISGIEPFDTMNIPAYSPDYLSGYSSEVYTVDLQDAHRTARNEMRRELERQAERDVLSRYDHVRNLRMDDRYRKETYKHVLLPVYATAYYYKNKKYTVLINGQSGRIDGEYPKSPAKIVLLILLALMIIGIFFMAIGGSDEDYGAVYRENKAVCQAEYEETDVLLPDAAYVMTEVDV